MPAKLAERARAFFTALLSGEPGALVGQSELPFYLEDKRINSLEQLKAEWLNQLRSKRTDLVSFKGFEALTPSEMEQRFGKPPARLAAWPLHNGKTYLVVASLSGRAAVALYHEVGDDWRIVAYHD
jgi:alpha-ketoglutarate-dependent taurine dioxygenase